VHDVSNLVSRGAYVFPPGWKALFGLAVFGDRTHVRTPFPLKTPVPAFMRNFGQEPQAWQSKPGNG
jgi:hypothetical protein